ncbi:MAG TPA: ATP-binding cassette domain-containing protein, partial [Rhodospirillales bacterium]|nr:ATP-binding cassette domain-containing protein [Rhodospirillales bacterium]
MTDDNNNPPHRPDAPSLVAAPSDKPRLVTHNRGLVAKNMGKRFKKRPVVRGVSMSLQRGEVVGLLGPNGAGKTTCFYMIIGLM